MCLGEEQTLKSLEDKAEGSYQAKQRGGSVGL